jgi:nucleoside-diphosphate-sugar epimerase
VKKMKNMKLNTDIALRAAADLLMINFSLALAFAIRFFGQVFASFPSGQIHFLLYGFVRDFAHVFLGLSVVCLAVFALSGFYTRGRAYTSRFKAVVVFQAVSLSFLVFGFIAYLFPHHILMPRAVLAIAWVLSLGAIGASRLWSVVWKKMSERTSKQDPDMIKSREKTVLVIGGAGYIGSALLPKLLHSGYKVRILDLFLYGEQAIKPYLEHKNLTIIRADFRQIDRIVEAVQGVGSVIHLGAIVGDPACALSEDLTIEVNLMATKMIAEICKGYGVRRFVFASTCSVYGASDEILNENSRLRPVSLYARSKIASENVLHEMADENFAPVILRFGTVFGNSGRTRFDLVVNILTARACFDKKFTLFGGDQWRPFLHVDDAAGAAFKALEAPVASVYDETFNVGDNQNNYTLQQVAELVKAEVAGSEYADMGRDGDRRNYRVDFSKINQKMRFKAKWTVVEGIRQVAAAIECGDVKNYNDPAFSNVQTLRDTLDNQIATKHIVGVKDLIENAAWG